MRSWRRGGRWRQPAPQRGIEFAFLYGPALLNRTAAASRVCSRVVTQESRSTRRSRSGYGAATTYGELAKFVTAPGNPVGL